MPWIEVQSSNIAMIAHWGGHLFVKFHNGGVYGYENVPIEVHDEIGRSDSVGSAFHRLVKSKPDTYPFIKVN